MWAVAGRTVLLEMHAVVPVVPTVAAWAVQCALAQAARCERVQAALCEAGLPAPRSELAELAEPAWLVHPAEEAGACGSERRGPALARLLHGAERFLRRQRRR